MKQPKPIELLQERLEKFERARNHSVKTFKEGDIDEELYDTYMGNLTPLIEENKFAIPMLKK